MFIDFLHSRPQRRYERQLEDVEHIVMHETRLKKERLYEILEILYEHRIID